jgi:proline iminopeptidase
VDPEGFLNIGGYRIYYRSEGEPKRGTILGLHGGPGLSYDYLSPLFDLAGSGYRVVFYDQSGGGKSGVPKNPAAYTIERFVEEAEGVRSALKLGKVHLFGFSWGGMLAQAYALKYQRNLASLILSGTCSSMPELEREVRGLVRQLPAGARQAIAKYEDAGDFENPEYSRAVLAFRKLHEFRGKSVPAPLKYSFEHIGKMVGDTLFGPNLVEVTGNLRYWSVTDRLSILKLPCLIVCGEHDFLSPRLHQAMHREVKGSKLVILKDASHVAMWEVRDEYLATIRGFLDSL